MQGTQTLLIRICLFVCTFFGGCTISRVCCFSKGVVLLCCYNFLGKKLNIRLICLRRCSLRNVLCCTIKQIIRQLYDLVLIAFDIRQLSFCVKIVIGLERQVGAQRQQLLDLLGFVNKVICGQQFVVYNLSNSNTFENNLFKMSEEKNSAIKDPMDLIKYSLDEKVLVKCRGERELHGTLHAYDQHLNMILGDVEETWYTVEVQPETMEEITRMQKRSVPSLFVRGDCIMLINTPVRK
eukprot:TRINITY_DN402_c0_g1_i3.p3 TRINITY_DN402_c0_g1~~TRINITY_DN402_c0_g1_i3.p3  ORF type:complete len:238 (-),score=17.30 TRINITY_DN402_c0_g1_i3:273-986(-)